MEDLLELVYRLAIKKMYERLKISKEKALTYSLAWIIRENKASPESLGDIYLDFLIYQRDIKNGEFDKFLGFFEIIEKRMNYNEKINLIKDSLKSSAKEKNISILASSKLVGDYDLVKKFEAYLKLKDIKNYVD